MESPEPRVYYEQLAPDYLTAAWEAFRDACDPRVIYRHLGGEDAQTDTLGLQTVAHRSQVASLRNTVIYSAMACEAAANDFLAETTGAAKELFDALDRLPTVKKLLAGPQAVLRKPLFAAGSEPLQSVDALFKRRNDLVHPRARTLDITGEDSYA